MAGVNWAGYQTGLRGREKNEISPSGRILKQDNKTLMNDNTRLRKEVDQWMKKSQENLRLSFKHE